MENFWLCFVPLFVAVDPVGVLPLYMNLTEGIPPAGQRPIIFQSTVTAVSITIAFLFFGPVTLSYLGISVTDFMIAGGILLLILSISDLLTGTKKQREIEEDENIGAVPIGIPLLCGPALLTTSILLASSYGKLVTAAAAIANIVLAGIVFLFAEPITRKIGRTGTGIISKLASLLLAAIAIMLIRKGIFQAIASVFGSGYRRVFQI